MTNHVSFQHGLVGSLLPQGGAVGGLGGAVGEVPALLLLRLGAPEYGRSSLALVTRYLFRAWRDPSPFPQHLQARFA